MFHCLCDDMKLSLPFLFLGKDEKKFCSTLQGKMCVVLGLQVIFYFQLKASLGLPFSSINMKN